MCSVTVCPICGEVEQTELCVQLPPDHPSIGEESSEGTIEIGWLACADCAGLTV